MLRIGSIRVLPNGDVEWEIPDLESPAMEDDDWFLMMTGSPDSFYLSPDFDFGGEEWCFAIWPNGCAVTRHKSILDGHKSKDSVEHMDVGLKRCSSFGAPPIPVRFSIALKTVDGQKDSERRETKVFQSYDTHYIYRLLYRSEYRRRKSEFLIAGCLTIVCTIEIVNADEKFEDVRKKLEKTVKEKDDIRKKFEKTVKEKDDIRKKLEKTVKEKDDIKKELNASKVDNEILLKAKLDLEADLKTIKENLAEAFEDQRIQLEITVKEKDDIKKELDASKAEIEFLLKAKLNLEADLKTIRENLATVTQEKEELFKDLTDMVSRLNTEVNNLSKRNDVLTKEKDESVMKYEKSLEESYMENSQLKEQLIALSQELVTEKKEKEHIKSIILIMVKRICELQSTVQDNMVETKENGEAVEVSTVEINSNKADKSEIAESNESKDENKSIETKESVSSEDDIVTNFNMLLKKEEGVDVTFVLETSDGDTEVFAHQLILAIRSPFFEDEFYKKRRAEGHKVIALKGINPKVFKKMIRYCYDCETVLKTIEDACALFKVAFEFRVTSLGNLCVTFLKQTKIEPRNVFSVLEVSEQIENKSLTDICLKVLEEKTENVISSYELRDITPWMVHSILKLSKLSLNSEYELVTWILNWAKLKSEDKDLNCNNTRDYVGNLVRDINFLSLTVEEFTKLCKDHPDFFTLEEIASFSMNIVIPGAREMPEWYNKDLKPRVYTESKK